jgi:hypothetical protein
LVEGVEDFPAELNSGSVVDGPDLGQRRIERLESWCPQGVSSQIADLSSLNEETLAIYVIRRISRIDRIGRAAGQRI